MADSILIIGGEPDFREKLVSSLTDAGYEVTPRLLLRAAMLDGIPGYGHGCDRLQILDRTEAEESINATQKGCRVNAMDNRPRDMLPGARGN